MFGRPATFVTPLGRPDFKPYLIRALLDWCEDEGYTPYALVKVDDECSVPVEYVNPDKTIVFCVSEQATKGFEIDNESMHFQARFGESVHSIYVPLGRIAAIYPKENTDLVSYFAVTETKPSQKQDSVTEPVFKKV